MEREAELRGRFLQEIPASVRSHILASQKPREVLLFRGFSFDADVHKDEFAQKVYRHLRSGQLRVHVSQQENATVFDLAAAQGEAYRLVFDDETGRLAGIIDLDSEAPTRRLN